MGTACIEQNDGPTPHLLAGWLGDYGEHGRLASKENRDFRKHAGGLRSRELKPPILRSRIPDWRTTARGVLLPIAYRKSRQPIARSGDHGLRNEAEMRLGHHHAREAGKR